MKINQARIHNLTVPLIHPYQLSQEYGLVTDTTIVVAEIHTDTGLIGWGECDPWKVFTGDSAEEVTQLLKKNILPALLGQDPTNIHQIHQIMDECVSGNQTAKSAIDMACHDLLGKHSGLPVHTLLGGKRRSVLPCFWSVGGGTPEETAAAVLDVKQRGFQGCMLKIGGADWKNDVARTLTAREAAGADFPLVADANQGWNTETAIAYGKAAESADLLFIEQPVKARDIAGLAQVRHSISTPISADESIVSMEDARALIEAQACDIFSIKVTKHGGLEPARRLCEYAAQAGIQLFFNSMHEEGIAQAASLHLASTVSGLLPTIGHSFFSPMRLQGDITNFHTWTNNGFTTVPDHPGLGFTIDKTNFFRFLTETTVVSGT